MSQENIAVAEAMLEAWRTGSVGKSGLLDPAAEWINPADAVERGTRRGAEEYISAGEAVRTAFGGARIEVDRFVAVEDRVVAIGTLRGHGRESGVEIERRVSLIWTVRDGRILRFEWFFGPDEARRAAGIGW